MSTEALLHYKKLGLKIESDWAQGTITPATQLIALRENGIVIGNKPQIITPLRISGRASKQSARLGTFAPKLSIPAFFYPTGGVLDLLKLAFGTVASTEVASFTVGASNNKIDFNIGAGELTATVASSTYVAGQTQTDAGTLCKAIFDAIVAAEAAGTYTVSYSRTTKKFTITRSAGTFQLKWATGTNTATSIKTLLGYANSDDTGSLSYVSDTAVVHVFDHVFSALDAITYGLSAGATLQIALAQGPKVYDVLDAVLDVLKLSFKPNQELMLDCELEARKVADSAATLASLTEETTLPLLFHQLAYTVGGASRNLSGLEVSFGNNYKKDLLINSQYRSKFVRNGPREVKGTFTYELADSTAFSIYDDMLAGTQPALVGTWTAATGSIKTGFTHTVTANLYKVQYDLEAVPGGGGAEAPDAPIPFIAIDDGSNGEMRLTVRNEEASI